MVIFKKVNNSYAKVVWEHTSEDPYNQNPYTTLDNLYAIRPEGFMFDPKFKANRKNRFSKYDGKVRLYKILPSLLPLGLVREAVRNLRNFGWKVEIDEEIISSFLDKTDYSELIDSFCRAIENACGLSPRDYQRKILSLALRLKRSSFRAATGAGKSLAMYMIVRFFMKAINPQMNFLILVPNINLVNQLYRNFRDDYGWKNIDEYVGMYHSDFTQSEKNLAIGKKILISTWQSMGSMLEKDKSAEYFSRFSCIIVDELHTAKNDQSVINKVISSCGNAEYRFGLTGTIPRHILNQKVLIGNFGEIQQIISSKELIDRGELSKAKIVEVKIPYDQYTIDLCRKKKIPLDAEYELSRLTSSHEYAIHSLIRDGYIKKDQNTLILMKYVENSEVDNMVKMLEEKHPDFKIRFAHGKVKVKTRDSILQEIESESGIIVVATYSTFGTGFNMKNLHNVIFSSDCKSYFKILQSIGRSLRVHKSKTMARIFDLHHMIEESYFSTRANKQMEFKSNLSRHYYEREDFYNEEEYPLEYHEIDKEFSFKGLDLDGVLLEKLAVINDKND